MNRLVVVFCMFLATLAYAQKNMNQYKYIIVADKFDFLKKSNQYQTSSLTKFLFNKYGFKAYLENENLPKDLTGNRCLALTATVVDNSGFLKTKNKIELRNCKKELVFATAEGISRQKDYKKAYHEAIRKAFNSLKKINYKYENKEEILVKKEPIKKQLPQKNTIVKSQEVLYAQQKGNGYQLVNTKPEIVFEVLKTSKPTFFILKNKKGILFKENNNWLVEYYENDKLITKQLKLKF